MRKFSLAETTAIIFLILNLEIDLSIIGIPEEIKRFIILVILGFWGFKEIAFRINNKKIILKQKYLIVYLLYLGWTAISLIWSIDFWGSLSSVMGLFFGVIFVIGIYDRIEPDHLMKAIKRNSSVILIASILALIFLPGYAKSPDDFFRLKGIMIHSQKLAILSGLTIILIVYEIKHNRSTSYDKALLFLSAIVLFLVKTRAFSTFIIIVVLMQIFAAIPKKRLVLFILLGLLLSFLIDFNSLIMDLYSRGGQDVTNLTGRTLLWADTISYIIKNPVFGYGFGAFKTGIISYTFWTPPHAHNLWLHVTFETGIIGSGLITTFLFLFYIFIKRYKQISFSYYMLIFIVLASLTGIIIGYLITPIYIIFLLFLLLETDRIQRYV